MTLYLKTELKQKNETENFAKRNFESFLDKGFSDSSKSCEGCLVLI